MSYVWRDCLAFIRIEWRFLFAFSPSIFNWLTCSANLAKQLLWFYHYDETSYRKLIELLALFATPVYLFLGEGEVNPMQTTPLNITSYTMRLHFTLFSRPNGRLKLRQTLDEDRTMVYNGLDLSIETRSLWTDSYCHKCTWNDIIFFFLFYFKNFIAWNRNRNRPWNLPQCQITLYSVCFIFVNKLLNHDKVLLRN